MHDRAERLGTLSAVQDAPDQTLGPARAELATSPIVRRRVLSFRPACALEFQADRRGVARAAHHPLGPLQVEETARHVGPGVGVGGIVGEINRQPRACIGKVTSIPLAVQTMSCAADVMTRPDLTALSGTPGFC